MLYFNFRNASPIWASVIYSFIAFPDYAYFLWINHKLLPISDTVFYENLCNVHVYTRLNNGSSYLFVARGKLFGCDESFLSCMRPLPDSSWQFNLLETDNIWTGFSPRSHCQHFPLLLTNLFSIFNSWVGVYWLLYDLF